MISREIIQEIMNDDDCCFWCVLKLISNWDSIISCV